MCSNSHQNNRAIYGTVFCWTILRPLPIFGRYLCISFVLLKVKIMSKNGFTNVDGYITKTEDARISVLDRGFLYGDSLYEVYLTLAWVEILHLDYAYFDNKTRPWQQIINLCFCRIILIELAIQLLWWEWRSASRTKISFAKASELWRPVASIRVRYITSYLFSSTV